MPVPAATDRRLLSVDADGGSAHRRGIGCRAHTRRFDEWDLQLLTMAGRMAGVLLEVEALRRTQRASAFRSFPAGQTAQRR